MNPNLAAEHCFQSSNMIVVDLPPRRTPSLNWKSCRNKIRQFTNLLLVKLQIQVDAKSLNLLIPSCLLGSSSLSLISERDTLPLFPATNRFSSKKLAKRDMEQL